MAVVLRETRGYKGARAGELRQLSFPNPLYYSPKGIGDLTVTAAPSAQKGQRGTAMGPSLACKYCRGGRDRWAQINGVNSQKYR